MKEVNSGPKLIELKPDSKFLDPQFNGYKLSLEPLPSYNYKLETGVDQSLRSHEQFTLHHLRLFTTHNGLFIDPWTEQSTAYYVDKDWNLRRILIHHESCGLGGNHIIWKVPRPTTTTEGRFNFTLSFPDPSLCVVSDGTGSYYLLNTGNREEFNEECVWDIAHSNVIDSPNTPTIILDSIKYGNDSIQNIDLLFLQINSGPELNEFLSKKREKFTPEPKTPFVSNLIWITLEYSSVWSLKSKRQIIGHGGIDFASIEERGLGLVLASESRFYYYFDSEKPIEEPPALEAAEDTPEKKHDYIWTQNKEDITLWFRLPLSSEIRKGDITVDVKSSSIRVEYQGEVLLVGNLAQNIISDETLWSFQPGKLEIVLQKVQQGLMWEKFVKEDDFSGKEFVDPDLVAEIHSQLAHLCTDKWEEGGPLKGALSSMDDFENCDEGIESFNLMRIDRGLRSISHLANLSSHQWLFNTRRTSNQGPSICIRHDVDGILWSPTLKHGDEWGCEHIATFMALGYVQASKQERKFTICPPDYSYAVIAESSKHIYIYRQVEPVQTDLRNRKTGERVSHIARQQIISLVPAADILGIGAFNDKIIVLTNENIKVVRIKTLIEDS